MMAGMLPFVTRNTDNSTTQIKVKQMKRIQLLKLAALATALLPGALLASQGGNAGSHGFEASVIVSGLDHPTGIAIQGSSTLFITQLPTPGVAGGDGGRNTVDMIKLGQGGIQNITTGEPEPTNLTLDKHGNLYWTCKSAGVILERSRRGAVSLFLGGLSEPSGIGADQWDNIFFTQIPTPGVPGGMGGMNTVNVSDGSAIHVLTLGEPEPTDIVVSRDGDAYWTCKSAGVILKLDGHGVVSLLLDGLQEPVGIAIDNQGRNLYFTEVPTPGVPGTMGGMNKVSQYDLHTGELSIVNFGDPEPTDIAVGSNGNLYWTCTSAGVIVEAKRVRM